METAQSQRHAGNHCSPTTTSIRQAHSTDIFIQALLLAGGVIAITIWLQEHCCETRYRYRSRAIDLSDVLGFAGLGFAFRRSRMQGSDDLQNRSFKLTMPKVE